MENNSNNEVRTLDFVPSGSVCSQLIHVEVEGDAVKDVRFIGGCHGNTQGVSALIRGMKVEEAIARLEGINCHGRGTSCPDQLAQALKALR